MIRVGTRLFLACLGFAVVLFLAAGVWVAAIYFAAGLIPGAAVAANRKWRDRPGGSKFPHRGYSVAAVALGGVAERSNAAVSKTVSGGFVRRGFKSLPLRFSAGETMFPPRAPFFAA